MALPHALAETRASPPRARKSRLVAQTRPQAPSPPLPLASPHAASGKNHPSYGRARRAAVLPQNEIVVTARVKHLPSCAKAFLKGGISSAQASAELKTIHARLSDEVPEFNKNYTAEILPLREVVHHDAQCEDGRQTQSEIDRQPDAARTL